MEDAQNKWTDIIIFGNLVSKITWKPTLQWSSLNDRSKKLATA